MSQHWLQVAPNEYSGLLAYDVILVKWCLIFQRNIMPSLSRIKQSKNSPTWSVLPMKMYVPYLFETSETICSVTLYHIPEDMTH
jgi:hypothetical protein